MSRLIDVSRPLHAAMPVWPGDAPFERRISSSSVGDRRCLVSSLQLSAHAGTHVDAPSHLAPEGEPADGVERLELQRLIGPVTVVDARWCSEISASLVHRLAVCPARILFRTDSSDRPYSTTTFVSLSPEAAEALVSRACLLVGIDGPSVDPVEEGDLPAHRVLLDAGVVVVEGLDLSRAAPGDYELLCLPLLVAGAEAAPARVVLWQR